MMYPRLVNTPKSNSFFLFGARGTGKSTLLKISDQFKGKNVLWIDLLKPEEADLFIENPSELTNRIHANPDIKWVVIDEVQKCPPLLDLVHLHIEDSKFKQKPIYFALTGSSSRKLRRGQANLLAGRAWLRYLYPLTHLELGQNFNLDIIMHWGSLPSIFDFKSDNERKEYLNYYSRIFVSEEIVAEQVVRKLLPFKKFLQVAAQSNGSIINSSKIARDIGSDYKTVQSYFQILEDTHLGYFLYPEIGFFRKSLRKMPKFYFFDIGVCRTLSGQISNHIVPRTTEYGHVFEQFIILEIMRLNEYKDTDFSFSYMQTKDHAEVDLIIKRPGKKKLLVEIKSTDQINLIDLSSFIKISSDYKDSEAICLSRDPYVKQIKNVRCMPWDEGISVRSNGCPPYVYERCFITLPYWANQCPNSTGGHPLLLTNFLYFQVTTTNRGYDEVVSPIYFISSSLKVSSL